MYIIVSMLLLLPPTLLFTLSIVLTLMASGGKEIAMLLVAMYSYGSLWRIVYRRFVGLGSVLSMWLWLGVILTPVSGAWMLYLFFEGTLGEFEQVYYFSLAPVIFAAISAYRSILGVGNDVSTTQAAGRRTAGGRFALLLSYVCFFSVFVFLFIAMIGTLMVRGYGAVGDLLSPLNWVNWGMLLIMMLPGLCFHRISQRGRHL